jgi:hypothetical protein
MNIWFFSFLLLPFGSLLPLCSIGLISQFLHHSQTVGLLGRVISSTQGLYLKRGQRKQKNAHTHQTSMTWVGFEPKIPASERAKTVHALDRSATVTGVYLIKSTKLWTMSWEWIEELAMCLHSEHDVDLFLLYEQDTATCNLSYNFSSFIHDGRALVTRYWHVRQAINQK